LIYSRGKRLRPRALDEREGGDDEQSLCELHLRAR
jgi:hypothetical protein